MNSIFVILLMINIMKTNQIQMMKILKKYNSVLEENLRLKQELIKYQKWIT